MFSPPVCGQSSSFLNFQVSQIISVATKPFIMHYNHFPHFFFLFCPKWWRANSSAVLFDFMKKSMLVIILHLDKVVDTLREKKKKTQHSHTFILKPSPRASFKRQDKRSCPTGTFSQGSTQNSNTSKLGRRVTSQSGKVHEILRNLNWTCHRCLFTYSHQLQTEFLWKEDSVKN